MKKYKYPFKIHLSITFSILLLVILCRAFVYFSFEKALLGLIETENDRWNIICYLLLLHFMTLFYLGIYSYYKFDKENKEQESLK